MTIQQKIEQKKAELQELENQLEQEKNDPKKFLLEILGNELRMKVDADKYPNSVFYFKGDTCLLEMEKSNDDTYLWCNYWKIWNPISERFSLNYASIQDLIRETLEEHFKMRDVTPGIRRGRYFCRLEEHFKMRDVTPEIKK